jgi:hypothetical protein
MDMGSYFQGIFHRMSTSLSILATKPSAWRFLASQYERLEVMYQNERKKL